jgi:hypothetical protein
VISDVFLFASPILISIWSGCQLHRFHVEHPSALPGAKWFFWSGSFFTCFI